MADKLNKGDKVEWNTSQGKTTGEVKKKLTSPTDIKGQGASQFCKKAREREVYSR